MKTIKDTEYVYACTRIKAAEGRGTQRERIAEYADAADAAALTQSVVDAGLVAEEERGAIKNPAEAADSALRHAASLLKSSVPDPSVYDFLFYKFDCNNIKTAMKELIVGEHDEARYFSVGTVSVDAVLAAVSSRDYSALPKNMAERAREAQEAYETAGDARAIDLLLDKGCFEDMTKSAKRSGVPFFEEYVSALADSVNYTSYCRISSSDIRADAAAALIARASVPGGSVPCETFADAAQNADGHDARIDSLLLRTDRAEYREALRAEAEPGDAPDVFSGIMNGLISRYDFSSFCPEIPAVFFIKREAEIRFIRTVASMLASGRGKDEIRKRLASF